MWTKLPVCRKISWINTNFIVVYILQNGRKLAFKDNNLISFKLKHNAKIKLNVKNVLIS